jgi:hypothetical protein
MRGFACDGWIGAAGTSQQGRGTVSVGSGSRLTPGGRCEPMAARYDARAPGCCHDQTTTPSIAPYLVSSLHAYTTVPAVVTVCARRSEKVWSVYVPSTYGPCARSNGTPGRALSLATPMHAFSHTQRPPPLNLFDQCKDRTHYYPANAIDP